MSDLSSRSDPNVVYTALDVVSITPDDANDLPQHVRGFTVNSSGFVRVTAIGGGIATLFCHQGMDRALRVKKVWAAGTTAEGITGFL